jgi:hypothetical protein
LGIFWKAYIGLEKFALILLPFGISYVHLAYILYDPLVYRLVIWYIFPRCGIFYEENLTTLLRCISTGKPIFEMKRLRAIPSKALLLLIDPKQEKSGVINIVIV